jgi:hypothetical protein
MSKVRKNLNPAVPLMWGAELFFSKSGPNKKVPPGLGAKDAGKLFEPFFKKAKMLFWVTPNHWGGEVADRPENLNE